MCVVNAGGSGMVYLFVWLEDVASWLAQARKKDAVMIDSRVDISKSYRQSSQRLLVPFSHALQPRWCRVLQSSAQLEGLHKKPLHDDRYFAISMRLHGLE